MQCTYCLSSEHASWRCTRLRFAESKPDDTRMDRITTKVLQGAMLLGIFSGTFALGWRLFDLVVS